VSTRWQPGRRPPWWPEGETWPPRRPPWAGYRGRFVRRALLLLIGIIILAGLLGGAFGWLLAGGPVGGPPRFHPFFFPLFWLLLVVLVLAAVSGSMRRLASPVGNLVEAAGRIEAGDYSVRVPELGPAEVRSMARALNALTAHLQAAESQRRSFLADVAHELKTPLSIIRGQAEGIADGMYPGDVEHLAPIIDATRTLERLVDDLRTLTLSEAGNLRLQRERIDPGALVRESAASFRAQAAAAGVRLRDEIGADLPEVDADPLRISGVIANLVANALAHTPSGGTITISAEPAGSMVEIAVRDTGSGVAPELLPRIFDRFVRGPSSRGSGLGLAIARDLVAAHGGRITAESPAGAGTTIRFTLPVASS
jgi:signal transduction histidine kinase